MRLPVSFKDIPPQKECCFKQRFCSSGSTSAVLKIHFTCCSWGRTDCFNFKQYAAVSLLIGFITSRPQSASSVCWVSEGDCEQISLVFVLLAIVWWFNGLMVFICSVCLIVVEFSYVFVLLFYLWQFLPTAQKNVLNWGWITGNRKVWKSEKSAVLY